VKFKKSLVLLEKIVSKEAFRKIRRKVSLCEYNYHSAVMVKGNNPSEAHYVYDGICKHCGRRVYLDYNGHWRFIVQFWSGSTPGQESGETVELKAEND